MSSRKSFWLLLITILGSSMAFIDATVVNVALPRIQIDLQASSASVQWVVEAYALFLGALILVGGSLGDRYGRKRIFSLGVAIFALASIWCGLTVDITQLIVARAVQGVGGALLTPGSLAILRAAFVDEAQRGKAIGLWSGFSSITSALGPVIGGWLVQNVSWRWVFFINIPMAVLVLLLLFWHVPESRSEQANQRLDIPGALLATLGLGLLVFGLIESNQFGLGHPLVIGCVLAGIVLLVVFVLVERYSPAPMMPLQLFHSRVFSGTNLLTLFLYAALGGTLFFLPFNLINVQGYSATAAGSSLLPFTLLMFFLSRWSGSLVARYGPKKPLVIGPLVVSLGYLLFALPDIGGSYWVTFFPAVVVLGLGMSITVAPLTTTVMGAVEEGYAGIASGVNNAVARIAGLLAIAIFGIFVLYTFNTVLNGYLAALHLPSVVLEQINAQRTKLTGIEIPASLDSSTYNAVRRAIGESFVSGFRLVMFIGAALALASSLCAFWLVSAPAPARHLFKKERLCGDNSCTMTYAHRSVTLADGDEVEGTDIS